jgi:hypothetical protein
LDTGTFTESYTNLSPSEKAQFADTIRILLSECLIWREDESKRQVYLFLKRYTDLVKGYLDIASWELLYHEQCATFQVIHREGYHKKRLNLDTTIWLLLLRLLYAEQQESTTPRLTRYPAVTIDTLIRRYTELPNARRWKRTSLEDALRQLQRFTLIRAPNGGSLKVRNSEQVIELLPPLEAVVTATNAATVAARLAEYLGTSEEESTDDERTEDS